MVYVQYQLAKHTNFLLLKTFLTAFLVFNLFIIFTETVMGLMNTSVYPGQSPSFMCEVPSTIPLQFTWYLNDQLVSNVTGSHMNVTASSSYTLNNVNYSDDNSNVRCSVAGSELVVNSSVAYLTGKLLWLTFQVICFKDTKLHYMYAIRIHLHCIYISMVSY